MKRSYFFVFILVVMVVISIAILAVKVPEETRVVSEDKLVSVTGLARSSQEFIINVQNFAGGNILLGPVYEILPNVVSLEEPVVLSFENSADLQVYKYNEHREMWSVVDRVVARTEDSISVEVDLLGLFSLGTEMPPLDLPDFSDEFEELLALAPKNTVGFEMVVGYDFGLGPLLEVSEIIIGGCDGLVENGNDEEISKVDFSSYEIVARWFTSDVKGCGEDQNLKASFGM